MSLYLTSQLMLRAKKLVILVPDAADQAKKVAELEIFISGKGLIARQSAKASARTSPAYQWWSSFGSSAPVLQHMAIKVLSRAPLELLQPVPVSAIGAPLSLFTARSATG